MWPPQQRGGNVAHNFKEGRSRSSKPKKRESGPNDSTPGLGGEGKKEMSDGVGEGKSLGAELVEGQKGRSRQENKN